MDDTRLGVSGQLRDTFSLATCSGMNTLIVVLARSQVVHLKLNIRLKQSKIDASPSTDHISLIKDETKLD
jgi:hypothetical protein